MIVTETETEVYKAEESYEYTKYAIN